MTRRAPNARNFAAIEAQVKPAKRFLHNMRFRTPPNARVADSTRIEPSNHMRVTLRVRCSILKRSEFDSPNFAASSRTSASFRRRESFLFSRSTTALVGDERHAPPPHVQRLRHLKSFHHFLLSRSIARRECSHRSWMHRPEVHLEAIEPLIGV